MKPLFTPERRICVVVEEVQKSIVKRGDKVVKETKNATERRAFFHLFVAEAMPLEPSPLRGGHPGGQYSKALAIVEYEDGTVDTVNPESVRFLDTEELMKQYSWGEVDEDDDLTEWVPTIDPHFPYRCKKCGSKAAIAFETGCPSCGRYLPKKEEPQDATI